MQRSIKHRKTGLIDCKWCIANGWGKRSWKRALPTSFSAYVAEADADVNSAWLKINVWAAHDLVLNPLVKGQIIGSCH